MLVGDVQMSLTFPCGCVVDGKHTDGHELEQAGAANGLGGVTQQHVKLTQHLRRQLREDVQAGRSRRHNHHNRNRDISVSLFQHLLLTALYKQFLKIGKSLFLLSMQQRSQMTMSRVVVVRSIALCVVHIISDLTGWCHLHSVHCIEVSLTQCSLY